MAEKGKQKFDEKMSEGAEELRARVRGFFPPEFRRHAMAARKEFLLAIRSLIDARIESIERAEKAASKKSTKIPVE